MIYDVVIIGAGPCGLSCAIEAEKAGLKYVVLEKGNVAESVRRYPSNMTFFSTAENIAIGDIPFPTVGPKAKRNEALQYYRKVAVHYELNIKVFTEVRAITPQEDGGYVVSTAREEELAARKIVLATGYFDFPRKLNIPGEEMSHVFAYYDEPYRYAFTNVVILGAGNSAVEAALDLYRHDVNVTIVHRKDQLKPTAKYWLLPDIQNRIKEGKINIMFETEATAIKEHSLVVRDLNTGESKEIPADFIFKLVGYLPDEGFFRQVALDYDQQSLTPLYDTTTFETSVKGVYVAGTVTAGTHTEKVFIENGRLHAKPIIRHICETMGVKA